ncbi:hypothetical protein AB0C81_18225 [Streptomyces roseoverticillatus]|uniref:hypothetical protein n=1 Tax=Streptomyces roseoverticillatus TaxID=66429 RepID=UPI0033DAA224
MAHHPLASLRASLRLSHPAYAQLVAEVHAQLGYGQMAARREKVSRWESGRTVPELTAQLAMAHIHQVPGEEVERLGWPHWLYLAADHDALLQQPWTTQGVVDSLRSTALLDHARRLPSLALTGSALASAARTSVSVLAGPKTPHSREGLRVRSDTVAWIEARTRALELHESGTSTAPAALHFAARAEHRLITTLLTTGGYDGHTGTRLLLLAARTAALCAWLSSSLGEEITAERYTLAAIRAATAAGARGHVTTYMAQLSIRHLIAGDPQDALSLVHAARAITQRPTAHQAASLHTKEALALARLGDTAGSARALDRAADALTADTADHDPAINPFDIKVDDEYLAAARGNAWLFLGQPKKALPFFATLLDNGTSLRTAAPASPYTARRLLYVVDAQLALGELDAAAHSVQRAVALTGILPPGLTHNYRQRLLGHRNEPAIRDLLDLLADTTP